MPAGDMTGIEHTRELRRRIIISLSATVLGAGIAYVFYDWILGFLLTPLVQLREHPRAPDQLLYMTTVFEGFLVRVKVSLLAGLVLSLPVHIYNAIRFIFPGLTRAEKRAAAIALVSSFILLTGGFFYGFYEILPVSIRFLTGQSFVPEVVGLLLSYDRSIFFVFQMLLVFVMVFQLPVVLVLLLMTNVVSRSGLLHASRYVVVGIFLVAAIVTPPDVVSQISIAVPMVGMFFLSILIARIFNLGNS